MTQVLNRDDIQGNITRAYGRFSFPFARYFFLHIENADAGRRFIDEARRKVTTAAIWTPETKPEVTLNIGFTYTGLDKIGLPTRTLQGMPESFVDGMKARAFILGDRDVTVVKEEAGAWCRHWDKIWRDNRVAEKDNVHIWISMNAQCRKVGTDEPVEALETQTQWLRDLCAKLKNEVRILATNGALGTDEYQAASAVFKPKGDLLLPTPEEHFGLTDGIGDPVFEGQNTPEEEKKRVVGRGKWMNKKDGWQPLKTGEFLLGHPDESQELPPTAMPPNLMHNGTFMVFRKLHENVDSWDQVVEDNARKYAAEMEVDLVEARETLKAKMVGRWSDGVPLSKVPTYGEWQVFRKQRGFDDPDPLKAYKANLAYLASPESSDFKFGDDMKGLKCPGGAHMRRVNTRDYLDPQNKVDADNPDATTQLNKRRRILRRGLPYGPRNLSERGDDAEQGVAMMMIGASIFRQFEFVQQQWIQYGLDFHQGNNTCPLLGDHRKHSRFTVPSDPATGKPPYVVGDLKNFVEPRGGDYFFIPSMTALSMMALGTVDPT